jgi:lysophospholipase L1-like esterase
MVPARRRVGYVYGAGRGIIRVGGSAAMPMIAGRRAEVRRYRIGAGLVAALMSAAASPIPSAATNPPHEPAIRVMPLGDSLTDGYNIPGGYRIRLASVFETDGVAFDFVGSLQNGPERLQDHDHEGHSGYRIDEISTLVVGWLRRYTPDVVLLMIGTNDVVQGHRLSTAPERLGRLIDLIATTLPSAHVFVASIPPIGGPPNAERVEAFNAEVTGVVDSRIDEGIDVTYVDINSVIEPSDLHTDYTHLDASGHRKVADEWYRALGPTLSRCCEGRPSVPDVCSPSSRPAPSWRPPRPRAPRPAGSRGAPARRASRSRSSARR